MKIPGETSVALVAGACMVAIAVLFRNVIHKQVDMLVAIAPFYLFLVYLITRGQARKVGTNQVLAWNFVIILVTFVIILVYLVI